MSFFWFAIFHPCALSSQGFAEIFLRLLNFIHSSFSSPIHSSFIHFLIILSVLKSFLHQLSLTTIFPACITLVFLHSFIRSFVHSFIHSFIHSFRYILLHSAGDQRFQSLCDSPNLHGFLLTQRKYSG
jgi:hypothetical protein